MLKKVLFVAVALLLFGLLLSTMVGEHFTTEDVLTQLEQVETYKWYPAQAEAIYQTIAAEHPGTDYALKAQKNLVISYLSAKRQSDAQQTIDKLLGDFSKHSGLPAALYDIARIYERSREYEKAKVLYQQIIQQYPDDSYAGKAQLAVPRIDVLSHIESKNDNAAQTAIDSLITNFSGHSDLPSSLYDIARRYERAKRYEKAKSIYQQVIQQYPDSPSAGRAQLGVKRTNILSLVESGDNSAAQAIGSLIIDFPGHPDLSEALYDIANRYERAKKYEEAKSIYQQVIQQYPDSSHAGRAQLIIPKINIFSLIESGNYTGAQTALDKLIADFSGHSYLPAVLSEIARRYEKLDKYEEAKSIYQQIIQQYPDGSYAGDAEVKIVKNQILFLIDVGQTEAAQAAIDKLISDFRGYSHLPWALSRVAGWYYRKASLQLLENGVLDSQGRDCLQKAVAIYEMVINEFPGSATAELYRVAGDCYRKLGEYEKSIEYYRKVVNDYSGYRLVYHAQFFMAKCFEAWRDSGGLPVSQANPQVEQAYKLVVEKYPDCKWADSACAELGWLNFENKQWVEAAQYFELLLSEYAENERPSSVLYALGRAYEEMGRLDLAIEVYSEFIETADPNDRRVESVKTNLEELGG